MTDNRSMIDNYIMDNSSKEIKKKNYQREGRNNANITKGRNKY
jgi:hypothetical protein